MLIPEVTTEEWAVQIFQKEVKNLKALLILLLLMYEKIFGKVMYNSMMNDGDNHTSEGCIYSK